MNFEQLADELKRLRGPHQNLQQAKILEQYPDAPDAARVLYEAQNKKLERALKSPSDRPQIQKPVSTRDDSEFDNAVSQRVRARMQSGSKGSVDSLSPLNGRLGAYQAAAARRKNKPANPGSTTADRVAARREQYGEFQPASNTARGVAQILAGKGDPIATDRFGRGSVRERYADGSEGIRGVDRTILANKESQSSRLLANRAASREREQARKSAVNQAVVAALNGGEYQPTGNAKNDTAAMNVFRNRREQMAQQDAQGRQMLMALAGQSPGGAQAYLNQMGANQRMGAEQQMLGQELASRERIAALQSGGVDKTKIEALMGMAGEGSPVDVQESAKEQLFEILGLKKSTESGSDFSTVEARSAETKRKSALAKIIEASSPESAEEYARIGVRNKHITQEEADLQLQKYGPKATEISKGQKVQDKAFYEALGTAYY